MFVCQIDGTSKSLCHDQIPNAGTCRACYRWVVWLWPKWNSRPLSDCGQNQAIPAKASSLVALAKMRVARTQTCELLTQRESDRTSFGGHHFSKWREDWIAPYGPNPMLSFLADSRILESWAVPFQMLQKTGHTEMPPQRRCTYQCNHHLRQLCHRRQWPFQPSSPARAEACSTTPLATFWQSTLSRRLNIESGRSTR